MKNKTVYFVVGESSGDLLASRLMQELQNIDPTISFAGTGGETMAEKGFQSLFDISDISVMGVLEVLPKLNLIMRRLNQVDDDINEKRPDVIVTVDSWSFVRQLLERLKKQGNNTPKIHYVAPQVWAWNKGRVKVVAKLIDRLMTLLPFEPYFFAIHGVKSTFVGHPVSEYTSGRLTNTDAFKTKYNIPEKCTMVSVLPGSRQSEIKRLIPVFKQTLKSIKQEFPDLFIVIPSVAAIAKKVETAFSGFDVPHRIIIGQNDKYDAFRSSVFAIAASGTVSLELTACGTPHVIAYSFGFISNRIAKLFAGTKYANLINIIAQKFIIPEFVLENCREKLITPKVLDLMQNPEKAKAQIDEALIYLEKLLPDGKTPSRKAAETVFEYLRS